MIQLKETDYQLLQEYKEMLLVMEGAFAYVSSNLHEEAPIQVQDVFNDLIEAFQKINIAHGTLSQRFQEDETFNQLLDDYKALVTDLTKWFEMDTNKSKKQLLDQQIIPQFITWRDHILAYIEPYTIQ